MKENKKFTELDNESMNHRLVEILSDLRLTQKAFAESLGVSANAVTEVIKGRTKTIPTRWLSALLNTYQVNANWILTGQGDKRLLTGNFLAKNTISDNLWYNVSLLPSAKMAVLEDFIGFLRQKENENSFDSNLSDSSTLAINSYPIRKDLVSIPLLGTIAAGKPIFAEENYEEEIFLPKSMVGQKSNLFALRVQGDSMIGAGILANDIAIVQSHSDFSDLSNGRIIVMLIHDEATIKYFFHEEEKFILRPANPHYQDIELKPDKEPRLLGILHILLRSYAK